MRYKSTSLQNLSFFLFYAKPKTIITPISTFGQNFVKKTW